MFLITRKYEVSRTESLVKAFKKERNDRKLGRSRGGLSLLSATHSTFLPPPPPSPFTPTRGTSLWYYEENAAERKAGDEKNGRKKRNGGKRALNRGRRTI